MCLVALGFFLDATDHIGNLLKRLFYKVSQNSINQIHRQFYFFIVQKILLIPLRLGSGLPFFYYVAIFSQIQGLGGVGSGDTQGNGVGCNSDVKIS